MSLGVGAVIDGKYEITAVLGEGGMGVVYEGRNVRIHRRVAIKVLHAAMASSGDAVARFEKEAQAAGRIGSQHIVEVLDLGHFPNGDRYLVMEFLEGESLGDRMKARQHWDLMQLGSIVHQLLEGLAAAHNAGIVHRDLKPDNVFLQRMKGGGDFVKLLDFGISKFTQGSDFSMTRTGSIMGSPYYMAPEQAKGSKQADHRVDLYAVGVILYELFAGRVPFEGDTFNALLFKIALETPPPLSALRPDLDPAWIAFVEKAMAREPNERFQSAGELQAALHHFAPSIARPSLPAVTATGMQGATLSTAPPVAASLLPRAPMAGTNRNWTQSGATELAPRKRWPAALLLLSGLLTAGGVTVFALRHAIIKTTPGTAAAGVSASGKEPAFAPVPAAAAPQDGPQDAPMAIATDVAAPPAAPALSPAVRAPVVPLQRRGLTKSRASAEPAEPTATTTPSAPSSRGRKLRRELDK